MYPLLGARYGNLLNGHSKTRVISFSAQIKYSFCGIVPICLETITHGGFVRAASLLRSALLYMGHYVHVDPRSAVQFTATEERCSNPMDVTRYVCIVWLSAPNALTRRARV